MSVSVRMLTAAIAAAAMIIGSATSGMAAAVYDYAGQDFTSAISPYTTLDSISGSITLSTPLGDNLNSQTVTPSAFSFFDGVQTLDQSNASPAIMSFSTDASGQITQWNVLVANTIGSIQTADFSGIIFDRVRNGEFGSASTSSPGSWTSLPATPLPPALWLFATGLGLTGLFGGRRKRKDSTIRALFVRANPGSDRSAASTD